jgi:hypothetical protein
VGNRKSPRKTRGVLAAQQIAAMPGVRRFRWRR